TDSPTSWYWKFGDNNTSILQNPTYTYTQEGTYQVIQTVGNNSSYYSTYQMPITVTAGIITEVAPANIWSKPADIVYGTKLNNIQPNATGSVPGHISYNKVEKKS